MSENLNEIEAPACPECNENYTYEMGELWACPMCGHEWERTAAGETEEEAGTKVLDSVGNELVDGGGCEDSRVRADYTIWRV